MKKITLICGLGMSTSMLLSKMEDVAREKGIEVKIRAIAESKFREYEDDTDVLLLGPQVGYLLYRFKEKYSKNGIKVAMIDSVDYGMMNGNKVLEYALNM